MLQTSAEHYESGKTISYSIQHFYHLDHSEIQRRVEPKFRSSLAHILYQHLAWQKLTVHSSEIPGEHHKKIRQLIWHASLFKLRAHEPWRFTWLDFAKDESPQKKCMSGCVRFTSRSICSIISEYCVKEKFHILYVTNKQAMKEGKLAHTCTNSTAYAQYRYTPHACTLRKKADFSENIAK